MQNPKYTTIPTRIQIPRYIKIGHLIGHQGRNLKPIADKTGTLVHVNTITNPAQIEIKIDKRNKASSFPPFENRIEEAKDRLNDLIKNLEKRKIQTKEKKKKIVRYLDDKEFDSDRHAVLRYQKEITLKKERKDFNREMASMIKRDMWNARKNVR